MKKILIITASLVALIFAFQHHSYAATTLFMGKTLKGNETSYDYHSGASFPFYEGETDSTVINFTNISEIKKIKIDATYEFGKFITKNVSVNNEVWDLQVGLPMVNRDKGMVYITLGAYNYAEFLSTPYITSFPVHEAGSFMAGLDVVGTPIEKFQFEINLQRSINGSTKLRYYTGSIIEVMESSLNLNLVKIKLQYVFNDNLGVALHYRWMDCNANPQGDAVDYSITSMGLIYRF